MGRSPQKHGERGLPDAESNSWTLAEAQERFAELIEAAAHRGPQTIVGRDHEFQLFLTRSRRSPKAKDLLLSGGRVGTPRKSGKLAK